MLPIAAQEGLLPLFLPIEVIKDLAILVFNTF
jgi:hypothetical protein